jgi:hypothetical protein
MLFHVVQSSTYVGISHSEVKKLISGCLRKYLRVQSTKHSRLTAMGPLSNQMSELDNRPPSQATPTNHVPYFGL